MKKITACMVGAGSRGMDVYGKYALDNPDEIEFVAVAEPIDAKRHRFQKEHNIKENLCFKSWDELLAEPKLADTIFICTVDQMHYEPTLLSLEKGYHVLLEKPMSNIPEECIEIDKAVEKSGKTLTVCHVLRYTKFFSTIKKLLDEGGIGKLVAVQYNENVGYWHHAHSFVRGNFRNSDTSSPMILAKSCHDMDMLSWLVGSECRKISSFGSLSHFKKENAPEGAPKRCLEGCPIEEECPYNASKIYLTDNVEWPTSMISTKTDIESRRKALMEGDYGRCVYHCDNNVVDNQAVNIEFKNGVMASFVMCAFTENNTRTLKLMGTTGEIRAHMEKGEICVYSFDSPEVEKIVLGKSKNAHGGGDEGLMKDFVRSIQADGKIKAITSAHESLQSHLMAFMAEQSRKTTSIVTLDDYIKPFG
jgi:predicted dehydrogenase